MADKNLTIYQRLTRAVSGNWRFDGETSHRNVYNIDGRQVFRTTDKSEYEEKKLELAQQSYLSKKWLNTNRNLDTVQAFKGKNNLLLMYTDADFMDSAPEISSALDTVAEESSIPFDNGMVVNVSSESRRIKTILEDLFHNRLDININAPMIIRGMCKYGNQYMLLNVDKNNGVKGWRQMPVAEMERLENGIDSIFSNQVMISDNGTNDTREDTSTKFRWTGYGNQGIAEFRNWQIAHFRLITNSMYLPYGVSYLNPARRHFRMLSMMEDSMLIYRLERSMERRVFKIFVGGMDDADIPAYMDEIANNFKRTPIVDPMTGQLDLRKNILPVHKDTPIPLLDGRTITIEELAKEVEDGKKNYVFSIQDGTKSIVPGVVVWCGKNYTADKLYKITLDDGTYTIMAGEHEVLMRNGEKRRADELKEGDSVMPFYNKYIESFKTDSLCKFVKQIEIIDGDDVYCMTVKGDNGEDDRHNFALRTINPDGSWNQNGLFVSNCTSDDYFIPVRDPSTSSPIESLTGAQNLTALDDIKYVQNKVLTALCIPKPFISFEQAAGDGKDLALMDIRFARKINRIQQAFIMELNKIAIIHLYLLGFHDELSNFQISMKNPSTQADMMNAENLGKKLGVIRDAVSDPGGGIPIMSLKRALTTVMNWSEEDYQENLEEIRLEKALSEELQKTGMIIQRSGIFDKVDKIYGEPGAEYQQQQGEGGGPDDGGPGGGGGGFGGGGGDFGGGLDSLGDAGAPPEEGELSGMEGGMPMGDMGAPGPDAGMGGADAGAPPMESSKNGKELIDERTGVETLKLGENFIINNEINEIINEVDNFLD